MAKPSIPEDDAIAMVRLLANLAIPGTIQEKRTQLLSELARMIDADFWTWSLFGEICTTPRLTHTVILSGGLTDEQLAKYLKVQEHPDLVWMTAPLFNALLETNRHTTRLQQEMVTEEQMVNASILPALVEADTGPIIVSGRPTSTGQFSVIALFRRFGRAMFSDRESRIAHILLSEVGWLHDTAWPQHPASGIAALSPRQRTILNLLLHGQGRKQIADSMGLSIHTVHGYAKEIYEVFGVHSHAELMRRFMEGDGGDTPDLGR